MNRLALFLPAILLAACGSPQPAQPSEGDAIEICLLCYRKSGDAAKQLGLPDDGLPSTVSLRLYNRAWRLSRPPGGPFEVVARVPGSNTVEEELSDDACARLFQLMWTQGFMDLPGDRFLDRSRFVEGYSTTAISVARNDERHIVFLEDVTGPRGDDPRWDRFVSCQSGILDGMSGNVGVRAKVRKDPPPFPK